MIFRIFEERYEEENFEMEINRGRERGTGREGSGDR